MLTLRNFWLSPPLQSRVRARRRRPGGAGHIDAAAARLLDQIVPIGLVAVCGAVAAGAQRNSSLVAVAEQPHWMMPAPLDVAALLR